MTSIKAPLSIFLILLLHWTIAWFSNQAQDAGPDVPSGKLRSLSFAPYHEGFSPIKQKFPLAEHVESDLRVIADKTHIIRTYSVRGGMQPTPEFARQYGVEMIMGGWMGDGHPENQVEIQALINAANQNPDVVKRVIVGNEVLLRKDMDIDKLISYIRQVKQAIKQPVTYADVWSSYMQYPQLFQEVDFITIHILPYWEDEPVAIEQAAEHVENIVKQIETKAHSLGVNKPILIGESGWPAAGRQRGQAVPGVVNEARFIRSLIQVANRHGFDYNIVEAFNQPWKSNSEGVVGANWGLLSIDREPVFPLTGPVSENPNWIKHTVWAMAVGLILVGFYFKRLEILSVPSLVIFLLLAQIAGVCLVSLSTHSWQTSYSLWQKIYSVFIVAMNSTLAVLLMQLFFSILASGSSSKLSATGLRISYLFFSLLAIYQTFSLAFNGRYLSFPVQQLTIPVLGIVGLIACSYLKQKHWSKTIFTMNKLLGCISEHPNDRFLAYLLGLGIVAMLIGETYSYMAAYDFIQAHPSFNDGLPVALSYTLLNRQLILWSLSSLILCISLWVRGLFAE